MNLKCILENKNKRQVLWAMPIVSSSQFLPAFLVNFILPKDVKAHLRFQVAESLNVAQSKTRIDMIHDSTRKHDG